MADHVAAHTDDALIPASPVRGKKLAGLEGPRGFGCLLVIFVHCSIHYAPDVLAKTRIDYLGQALTFFFVLSGFLLYLPYVQRLSDGKSLPKTSKYLTRRLLRVFPAYLVIFLIVNFVLRASYLHSPINVTAHNPAADTGMITDPFRLVAYLTLTHSLFPSMFQTGINTSWSLTAEWGFYLILPVIGFLLFATTKNSKHRLRAAMWPAAALLVIGVATTASVALLQHHMGYTTLQAYWGPNWVAVLARSFLGLADNFAFGMFAAVLFVALKKNAFSSVSTARLQWIFAGVTATGVVVSLLLFAFSPRFLATVFAFAGGAFILLIITPLARGEDSKIATIMDWAPMRKIGIISLSAYLWHYPIIIMVDKWGIPVPVGGVVGLFVGFAVIVIPTMILALLTYRFIELPAMNFRA